MVEAADGSWDQEHREEYSSQHEGGRHHSPSELGHGVLSGTLRLGAFFDAPCDVLAHHDGVVDHDSGGENQSEQNQAVEIRSAQPHHHEAADQCDRHSDARDQRQSPAPKEQHQHHKHQYHRITESAGGAIQVGLHGFGDIHDHLHAQAWRKTALQALERVHDSATDFKSVGTVSLENAHCDRAVPLEVQGAAAVTALAELDPSNILQANQTTRLSAFDHHGLEISPTAKTSLRIDGKAEQLSSWCWGFSQASHCSKNVLLGQRCGDVVGGEVELFQTIGIKPESEGQFAAAEHADVADARCCPERFSQVLIQPAADEDRFVQARRCAEPQDQQQVIGGTVHVQALASDGLGKPTAGQVHLVLNLDRIEFGIA